MWIGSNYFSSVGLHFIVFEELFNHKPLLGILQNFNIGKISFFVILFTKTSNLKSFTSSLSRIFQILIFDVRSQGVRDIFGVWQLWSNVN